MSCEIIIDSNNDEYTICVTGDGCGNFDVTVTASGEYEMTVVTEGTVIPTESDPVFVASSAYHISGEQIEQWKTAYGWGNHALNLYDTTGAAVTQRTQHEALFNHSNIHAQYSDAETASTIGTLLGGVSAATPASGDTFPFVQTIGSTLKKVTLANLITQISSVNYEASGTMANHLIGFDHALLHASGSDNQDLSGYSTTGHTHTGFETSGALSGHLTDYNHAAFLTDETDPVFVAHVANTITSGDIADWNAAYGYGPHIGQYDTSGGLSAHLLAYDHAKVWETSGEMSGHLTDFDHAEFLTAADLLNDYEASGSIASHLTGFNHALLHASGSDNQDLSGYSTTGHLHTGVYETSGALSGHLTDYNHAAFARIVTAPLSATGSGDAGTIALDDNYVYFCVTTNTWKRVQIATNWS